jgi:hypothetical protein
MTPEIGKPYQVAPGWYVVLKTADKAIIIRRVGKLVMRKKVVTYMTAKKDVYFLDEFDSLDDAMEKAEIAPWPGGMESTYESGYGSLHIATKAIEILKQYKREKVGKLDFRVLVSMLGHMGAYLFQADEDPETVTAYWAAAAEIGPDMDHIEKELADPDGFRDWALRLGAMHGRPLSSNERVELCSHYDPTMREFGMMAPSADDAPLKPTRKARSR